MKVNSVILLFCFCWTLVASRNEHNGARKHKQNVRHGDNTVNDKLEIKWHKIGVDLSKVYIEPENCKNSIVCGFFKLAGLCRINFFTMRDRCPLACRFCAPPQKTKIKRPPKCKDEKWECPVWAHNGDCIRFPYYMKKYCKLSCLLCGKDKDDEVRFDNDTLCPTWGSVGYCNESEEVRTKCKHSCDVYEDIKREGLDPDYENAFYHYPFYIYTPYTTLKEPLATVPPTEHPPSEKPLIPTLPPKYSTLAPTPAFTTPEPGEGLPTITPTEGESESPKPTYEPTKPSNPPPKSTEAPPQETPAPQTEAPPTEASPTEAPQPNPEPLPETPPEPQPEPQPQPLPQPTPQPPNPLPQSQTPLDPSSQPGGVGQGGAMGSGSVPKSLAGGGSWGGAVKFPHHHHHHRHRHFKKIHKHHHKSHSKHHKKHSHKKMQIALRKHKKHH